MKKGTVRLRVRNRVTTILSETGNLILNRFFEYLDPGARYVRSFKMGYWDGMKTVCYANKIPTGAFLAKRSKIEKAGIKLIIKDERVAPSFRTIKQQSTRDFQNTGLLEMVQASNSGGIVTAATGTGKTYLAGMYFKRLRGYGCFVVDESTLAKQSQKEIAEVLGEEVGYIGGGIWKPRRITVILVQTFQKRLDSKPMIEWTDKLEVIIFDEIHQQLNDRSQRIIAAVAPKAVFGFTATLQDKVDHIGLRAHALFGPIIYRFPYDQALKAGVLAPGVVIGVDLGRSHPPMPHLELKHLFITDNEKRNRLIAALAEEAVNRGHQVAILVDIPDHVKKISRMLAHIEHNTVYGTKSTKKRINAKTKFEEGDRNLIIANRVFKKGINIKVLDLIIEGSGLGNPDDAIQKFGRGTRLLKGKPGLIFIHIGDYRPKISIYKENKLATNTRRVRRAMIARLKVPVVRLKAREHTVNQIMDRAAKELSKIVLRSKK